ncbi:MAG TPA: CDP-diacylglycerol--glycerol-3-phosphate 3-phosphatidyltransferase [Sediminispirochaeta sp.]|nr:CDP-diacylglycerol--glycerol-3-phosphate 3-phosphatidyltransferase [Sediminispirochaeta sp.]
MNLPNKLTVFRIVLSPLFFVSYFFTEWTGCCEIGSIVLMILIFVAAELSDLLDGYIARKYQLVTDIGKVIDPFADVLIRVTYFYCFTLSGLMPSWVFLLIMYRELGITFLRMLMIRKGVAMAASVWGKAKAVTYAAGGIMGLAYTVFFRLQPSIDFLPALRSMTVAVFILGALSSVLSFVTYLRDAASKLKS